MNSRRTAAASFAMLIVSGASHAALIDAIHEGDRQAVEAFIQAGADVNAKDGLGTTPLMWAARFGDSVIVDQLLRSGADAAAENVFGVTPMSEAALIGSVPVIRRLLRDERVDPDRANPDGETALMLVARTGNVEAAKLLIDAGVDVNTREKWRGQTALMWAAAQFQPEMVGLLLENGADADARAAAQDTGRKVTAEPFPKEVTQGGFTPLLYAARVGCKECIEHLLAAGADVDLPDPQGVTPLMLAILNLHYDLASYLVERGADIDQWDLFGRTPLYLAIDMKGFSPPFSPPDRGEGAGQSITGLELARRLLERGANPNSQLKSWKPPATTTRLEVGQDNTLSTGATPLLRAAHASDLETMTLLLEFGALVDLPNASGITPLMAAAGVGVGRLTNGSRNTDRAKNKTEEASIKAVQMLLEAGANINNRTLDRRRLHSDPDIRRVASGYIVDFAYRYAYLPPSGRTALHGAAEKGWNGLIKFLMEHGADLSATDSEGMTPWDMAMGNYEKTATVSGPLPEPIEGTAELLESLCREDARCDLTAFIR